jgi:peptidoglycan/xylan/chitin deacetylase (PgdA/CDA1 family)
MTALICLTYDDALPVHRELVAPQLAECGLRGTFYVPAARDDLHVELDGWRKVAQMGHELGNHSCWHPCRTRPDWDWKPPYRLEDYDRGRIRDELLLANRILHLIDGRTERSYGATCGDLTCGPGAGESFLDDIRDLFRVVRAGQSTQPLQGSMPYMAPSLHGDSHRADDIIAVAETMRTRQDSWLLVGMHGVGAGTHNNSIDADEHRRLIGWIAAQRAWLDAVTMLEAAARLNRGFESDGPKEQHDVLLGR